MSKTAHVKSCAKAYMRLVSKMYATSINVSTHVSTHVSIHMSTRMSMHMSVLGCLQQRLDHLGMTEVSRLPGMFDGMFAHTGAMDMPSAMPI